jgi:hypothetical protein
VLINSIKQLGSNTKHLGTDIKQLIKKYETQLSHQKKISIVKTHKKNRIKEVSQKWKPLKQ